jgi:cardiolipin synthase A/B
VFEADLRKSKVVGFAEWQERPWKEKLAERWSRLLASQL